MNKLIDFIDSKDLGKEITHVAFCLTSDGRRREPELIAGYGFEDKKNGSIEIREILGTGSHRIMVQRLEKPLRIVTVGDAPQFG